MRSATRRQHEQIGSHRAPSESGLDRSLTERCRRRRLPAAALLLPAVVAAACTTGGIPILAPGEAKLGATALVFVDTNGIPNGDLYEHYDLSRDNVTLGIEDLVVTDRDGNELLREPGDATALFRLFAVRNQ